MVTGVSEVPWEYSFKVKFGRRCLGDTDTRPLYSCMAKYFSVKIKNNYEIKRLTFFVVCGRITDSRNNSRFLSDLEEGRYL